MKQEDICYPMKKHSEFNLRYYIDQWLNTSKLRCKASTYNKYFNICRNHITPFWGDYRTHRINVESISEFMTKISHLAPKSQSDILCVLKMILSYATNEGYQNIDWRKFSIRVPKSKVQILTESEQKRLISYLLTDINMYKLATYLTLCTGIRIGELCAIRRKDISFEDKQIYIHSTLQRIQTYENEKRTKLICTSPKSSCSVRTVPLSETLLILLEKYCYEMVKDAYLLSGSVEKAIEPSFMRYQFFKQLKECNLEKVRFHALRHTFATRWIESGADITTLSEILGHDNVSITLNRYVQSSVKLKKQASTDCAL